MPEKASWKDHYWYTVPVMRTRIEKILELARVKGKKVLECGCNEGFVSRAMEEDGAESVLATDYDIEYVMKANRIFGVKTQRCNVLELPFADKEFDVVVAGELLEHVVNPILALKELFRVARERIVISIPVGEYWLGELTHQWELSGFFINHDNLQVYRADKDVLILCWDRKRDENFVDIPPFKTQDIKDKYGIR